MTEENCTRKKNVNSVKNNHSEGNNKISVTGQASDLATTIAAGEIVKASASGQW